MVKCPSFQTIILPPSWRQPSGSIDVKFVDGKIIQRQVCRNDVKELRVPLQLYNLRAGDLRVRDPLSAPYIYGGQPVKGWESPSRKVVATLVEILDISEKNNIVISYAHTGKNKHKEYVDIHSLEFAPRLLEENFIDKWAWPFYRGDGDSEWKKSWLTALKKWYCYIL